MSAYSIVATATTLTSNAGGGGGGGGGGETGGGPTGISVTQDFGTILKGSRRVRGSLVPRAAGLVYSFTLTRFSRVTLHLSGLKFDADLILVDANGTVIAASRHPRKRAEAITLKLAAGTYYIEPALVDSTTTPFVLQFGVTPIKVKPGKAFMRYNPALFSDTKVNR
jgi:hypothetical protein